MTTVPPDSSRRRVPPGEAPSAAAPDLEGVDAALDVPPPAPAPRVEPPSPDVARVPEPSRLPGGPDYAHLPSGPVAVSADGPHEGDRLEWAPAAPRQRAGVAPAALALAIVALAASLFVGWMLPLGLAALVTAIVALRRAVESRAIAIWALVLALVSIAYSVGWLMWAIPQLPAA